MALSEETQIRIVFAPLEDAGKFVRLKLLETRALFAKIFTEESEEGAGKFKPIVDSLVESVTVLAARLVLCLGVAILFAATFVIALLFAPIGVS